VAALRPEVTRAPPRRRAPRPPRVWPLTVGALAPHASVGVWRLLEPVTKFLSHCDLSRGSLFLLPPFSASCWAAPPLAERELALDRDDERARGDVVLTILRRFARARVEVMERADDEAGSFLPSHLLSDTLPDLLPPCLHLRLPALYLLPSWPPLPPLCPFYLFSSIVHALALFLSSSSVPAQLPWPPRFAASDLVRGATARVDRCAPLRLAVREHLRDGGPRWPVAAGCYTVSPAWARSSAPRLSSSPCSTRGAVPPPRLCRARGDLGPGSSAPRRLTSS